MSFHVVLLRKDGTYNPDQLGLSSFATWEEAEIAILKMCLSHEWFMTDPDRAAIVENKSGQPYTLTSLRRAACRAGDRPQAVCLTESDEFMSSRCA